MDTYLTWASREYPQRRRTLVLGLLAVLFLGALPWLLVRGATAMDRRLGLPRLRAGIANPIIGGGLAAAGVSLGMSAIRAQVDTGSGTPLPMMPTRRLVVQPPFAYCRNPMTLGTVLGYGGIAVWLGSMSAVGMVAAAGALLLVYVRLVEERELQARFGTAYLDYKRATPSSSPA